MISPEEYSFNRNVFEVLKKAQVELELTDEAVCDVMDIDHDTFGRCRKGQIVLDLPRILMLASHLKINVMALLKGDVDMESLRIKYKESRVVAPRKYLEGGRSRKRTSIHIVDMFVEELRQRSRSEDSDMVEYQRAGLLDYFQLPHDFFDDPNDRVNIRLLTDICDYISEFKLGSGFFERAGRYSSVFNRGTEFHHFLKASKTPKEVFERHISQMDFFDSNYRYSILKLSSDRCVIRCVENAEAQDAIRLKKYGSKLVCKTKMGVASAISNFLDLPYSITTHPRCIHEGDPWCEFECNFEEATYVSRRKGLKLLS